MRSSGSTILCAVVSSGASTLYSGPIRPHSHDAIAIKASEMVGDALLTKFWRLASSLAENTGCALVSSFLSAIPSMPLSDDIALSTTPLRSTGAGLSSKSNVVLSSPSCGTFCASTGACCFGAQNAPQDGDDKTT